VCVCVYIYIYIYSKEIAQKLTGILMHSEQLSCVFHKIRQFVAKYNRWLPSDCMTSLSYCYDTT
jgi:hypothetical protein